MPPGAVSPGRGPWAVIVPQLFLLFLLTFICALGGYLFYKRQNLPGFGNPEELLKDIPLLAVVGLILAAISYILFDRYFVHLSPQSYPRNIFYILAVALKAALTEEIILRWSITTLAVALLKSKKWGVVFSSAIALLFTFKYFNFIEIKISWSYIFIVQVTLTFLSNLILGYLFVTKGLFHSMALKFFLGVRYLMVFAV
ncbi:MAG: hypothetical protein U9R36_00980 [Elusimicrobiota bacterium]|nr:hypothetical protein [Elusimicrobiota bacterium]